MGRPFRVTRSGHDRTSTPRTRHGRPPRQSGSDRSTESSRPAATALGVEACWGARTTAHESVPTPRECPFGTCRRRRSVMQWPERRAVIACSGPAAGDPAGMPAVPAPTMPVSAVVLAAQPRPGDDMGDAGRDLVIAAGATVGLDRPRRRDGAHGVVLVAVRSRLDRAEDIRERQAAVRPAPSANGTRFPAGHTIKPRTTGIRCSPCHVARRNRV